MFTKSIKENPLAWGIGTLVAVVAVYAGMDWMKKRKNEVVKVPEVPAVPAQARPVQARGKLPWAIGDVDIWADEKKTK